MLRLFGRMPEACALLLGGFDGFHVGHRSLLNEAKKSGLAAGLTSFSGCKGGEVFSFEEREIVFRREGFAFADERRFDDTLRNTSAEDFLGELFEKFPIKAVYCGEDFRFGKNAEGDAALLKRFAPCPVYALPLKTENGQKVSASRIKALLSEGKISEANALLGYGYFMRGVVEEGRRVGRTIGFPTANLSVPADKFAVKEGVYGGRAETKFGTFPAILNFGARPTFGVRKKKLEVYLKGFSGNLYQSTINVYPVKYLRSIRKFASEEELAAQLDRDKAQLEEL